MKTYAVGLLLDDTTDERAVALSKEYRPQARDRDFVLGPAAMPYMAHLHIMLNADGMRSVVEEIDRIAYRTEAPTGTFSEIVTVNDGWLFWRTLRTREMMAHHEAVVRTCAPHRSGKVSVTWPMTDAQRRMQEEHGYPAVMDQFDPHVTLQVLTPRYAHQPPRTEQFPWTALSLALFETGRHGSAKTIVHYRDFKNTPPTGPRAA